MSEQDRFEAVGDEQRHRGVAILAGRDRRTGLPVRIFRFRGEPRGAPERIDHANLPGVVALERDGDETRLVNLAATGYVPIRRTTITPEQVQAFVDALAALHAADVVHGGLGPERLRVSEVDGHVLLEGGGVPWQAPDGGEPTPLDDVRALAALLVTTADGLLAGQRIVLEDAAEGAGADDGVALSVAFANAGRARAKATHGDLDDATSDTSDARNGNGTVVKDLPPGGVYSSGESRPRTSKPAPLPPRDDDAPSRPRRSQLPRPAFLIGLVAAVLVWVAYGLRPQDAAPPTPAGDPAFVVRVAVAPADAPPLDIVVVEAPSGSELTAGSGLGRAPRRIQLDAAGRWVIEGRLGERRSAPVAITVPGASDATLTLPSADDPGDDPGSPDGG